MRTITKQTLAALEKESMTRHELVENTEMSSFEIRLALLELHELEKVWRDRSGTYHTMNHENQ